MLPGELALSVMFVLVACPWLTGLKSLMPPQRVAVWALWKWCQGCSFYQLPSSASPWRWASSSNKNIQWSCEEPIIFIRELRHIHFHYPSLQSSFRVIFSQPALTIPSSAFSSFASGFTFWSLWNEQFVLQKWVLSASFQALCGWPWLYFDRLLLFLSPPSSSSHHTFPPENHCFKELKC